MPLLTIVSEGTELVELLDKNNKKSFTVSQFDNLFSLYQKFDPTKCKILLLDVDTENYQRNRDLLRSNGFENRVKIIAVTANDSLENIRSLKEDQIGSILLKPVDRLKFNEILNSNF